MYMPNLLPRDVHHLWLSTDQPAQQRTTDAATSSFGAPPLSSYSSERPGPTHADEKLHQLTALRTLGYAYLAPLGVGKTMQTLLEESDLRRQMEEQLQSETATAENLMGEADLLQQQSDSQQAPVQGTPAQQQQQQSSAQQTPQAPQTQAEPHRDLDDDIPDAEEAAYEYDDEVDPVEGDAANSLERQYDRGFMITEQYESEDESQQRPHTHQSPVQFNTPQRDYNSSRQHHLAHSGSIGSLATAGGTTFESSFEANVSMNASDLDMTIDD